MHSIVSEALRIITEAQRMMTAALRKVLEVTEIKGMRESNPLYDLMETAVLLCRQFSHFTDFRFTFSHFIQPFAIQKIRGSEKKSQHHISSQDATYYAKKQGKKCH